MASQAQRAEDYSGIMDRYIEQGATRADKLGNRGPIAFDQSGKLSQHILDAYWETGFYVFEGLVGLEEIKLLRKELEQQYWEQNPDKEDLASFKADKPSVMRGNF